MSKFVFGPVPSRRLGFSLGVDIIPAKYCCFDCIYCQIGRTANVAITRKSFFDPHKVVEEVIAKAGKVPSVDHITFSGSGEPTLSSDIGTMIGELKKATHIPIAVITNGALLYQDAVRKDLMLADVVLPSLDAVSEDIFRYVNRPHPFLDIETIIRGLRLFKKEYRGKIWLEIMLIKDVSDDKEELAKLKSIVAELNVDRVQLNTVTRPPIGEGAGKIERTELERICRFLGPSCEIISAFERSVEEGDDTNWSQEVLETLMRRSLTLDDIVKITGVSIYKAKNRLKALEEGGQIKSYVFDDDVFYMRS